MAAPRVSEARAAFAALRPTHEVRPPPPRKWSGANKSCSARPSERAPADQANKWRPAALIFHAPLRGACPQTLVGGPGATLWLSALQVFGSNLRLHFVTGLSSEEEEEEEEKKEMRWLVVRAQIHCAAALARNPRQKSHEANIRRVNTRRRH